MPQLGSTNSLLALTGAAIALLLVAVALGLALYAAYFTRQARASRAWPSAPGILTASTVSRRGRQATPHYVLTVTYRYAVDGQQYNSSRIAFGPAGPTRLPNRASGQARYPQGGPVTVYYNPARPDQAVLEHAPATQTLWLAAGFILVMALIFYFGFGYAPVGAGRLRLAWPRL